MFSSQTHRFARKQISSPSILSSFPFKSQSNSSSFLFYNQQQRFFSYSNSFFKPKLTSSSYSSQSTISTSITNTNTTTLTPTIQSKLSPQSLQLHHHSTPSPFTNLKSKLLYPLTFQSTLHLYHISTSLLHTTTKSHIHTMSQQSKIPNTTELTSTTKPEVVKTDDEWRALLNPAEYNVLREADTDRRGIGYTNNKDEGLYNCKGCNQQLYSSETKFDSGCGWPSFDDCIPGAVVTRTDADGRRIEILCSKCHGHLGHVFQGEGFTPKDVRYCVNSSSITFYKKE